MTTRSGTDRKAKGFLQISKTSGRSMWDSRRLHGLLDHEIGTHFVRAANDQQWAEYRQMFGGQYERVKSGSSAKAARTISERDALGSEEGLATINTLLQSRSKLMYSAAMSYLTLSLAATHGFTELFIALKAYVPSMAQRWAQCYRAKRGLDDTGRPGALAKDQTYLEGAWKILERRNELHFDLMHSALVSVEEHDDAQVAWLRYKAKVQRTAALIVPTFLRDMASYHRTLEEIAQVNGIAARGCSTMPRSLGLGEMERLVSRKRTAKRREQQPQQEEQQQPEQQLLLLLPEQRRLTRQQQAATAT